MNDYEKGYKAGADDICMIIKWLRNKPQEYIKWAFDGEYEESEIIDSYRTEEILRRIKDIDFAFETNAAKAVEYMGIRELDKVVYKDPMNTHRYYLKYAHSNDNMVELYVSTESADELYVKNVCIKEIHGKNK